MTLPRPVVFLLVGLALLALLGPALAPLMHQAAKDSSRLSISQPAAPMAWNSDPKVVGGQAQIVVENLKAYWADYVANGGPKGPNPRQITCAAIIGLDGLVKTGHVWFHDLSTGMGISAMFVKGGSEFIEAKPTMLNGFLSGPSKLGVGDKWVKMACDDPNFPSGPLSLAQ